MSLDLMNARIILSTSRQYLTDLFNACYASFLSNQIHLQLMQYENTESSPLEKSQILQGLPELLEKYKFKSSLSGYIIMYGSVLNKLKSDNDNDNDIVAQLFMSNPAPDMESDLQIFLNVAAQNIFRMANALMNNPDELNSLNAASLAKICITLTNIREVYNSNMSTTDEDRKNYRDVLEAVRKKGEDTWQKTMSPSKNSDGPFLLR